MLLEIPNHNNRICISNVLENRMPPKTGVNEEIIDRLDSLNTLMIIMWSTQKNKTGRDVDGVIENLETRFTKGGITVFLSSRARDSFFQPTLISFPLCPPINERRGHYYVTI